MSLDPEELKRKRAQRKAQRQAARRKLVTRLILAGVVLLLCGVLILTLSLRGCSRQEDTPTEPVTGDSTPAPATDPGETLPPNTVIHFAAAGDLNVTQRVVASGGAEYDYTETFQDVAFLLADAELATVNLEGNLCGSPYGSNGSAPQSMMTALKKAGVDMIQLANSYSINRGISGLLTTIEGVKQAGMEPVGVFRDQAEFDSKQGFSLFEIKGVRIAVVSFTKGMDGTTLPPGNESCVNVLYEDYNSTYQKINKEKIQSVLESVQQQQPDITVALLHWGSEFNDTVSKSQKSICELLQENGVDAIIGTHPHYVQKIEFDPDAGTLVAYSLGDFIGDVPQAGSEYSVILNMEITKDNVSGEAAITGFSYTPIFTVTESNRPIRVLRIREAITAYESGYIEAVSQETYEAMKYALTRIEQRVAGE